MDNHDARQKPHVVHVQVTWRNGNLPDFDRDIYPTSTETVLEPDFHLDEGGIMMTIRNRVDGEYPPEGDVQFTRHLPWSSVVEWQRWSK